MSDSMTRSTTLSVILLVSAIFTGSMMHAHAARPAIESDATSASQGDSEDGAEQAGFWHIWAAATAQ
jgi:hypothetical protein